MYCQRSIPTNEQSVSRKVDTSLVFLQGHINGTYSGCIPHIVHISHIDDDVTLIILIEYGSLPVSSGLFDVFFAVHKIRILQMQNDMDNLKPAFENLDHYVKHTLDAMKKVKYNNSEIETAIKKFTSKWELLRKKYLELFKNSDKDSILSIESNMPGLIDALKELFRVSLCQAMHIHRHNMLIPVLVNLRRMQYSGVWHSTSDRNLSNCGRKANRNFRIFTCQGNA